MLVWNGLHPGLINLDGDRPLQKCHRQHKALMAFAKHCLQSNTYPTKVEFLKECVAPKPVPKTL